MVHQIAASCKASLCKGKDGISNCTIQCLFVESAHDTEAKIWLVWMQQVPTYMHRGEFVIVQITGMAVNIPCALNSSWKQFVKIEKKGWKALCVCLNKPLYCYVKWHCYGMNFSLQPYYRWVLNSTLQYLHHKCNH